MSSPQLTFSTLQSSDRLLSSPYHHPILHPRTSPPPSSLSSTTHSTHSSSHTCSVPSCGELTTSPALPSAFLPLATLCFPPTGSDSPFSHKSISYLCRTHRSTLQHFRQRAVTHAADSADLWTDDPHSSPVKTGDADRDEDDEQSRYEPTAESALVGGSFDPLRYSTFIDSVVEAGGEDGEKRPLSLAARTALAGGWLLVVSFVALTCAWGIVNQLRG